MKLLYVLISIFFSIELTAQDCDKALLAKKPGEWKAAPLGSTPNVSGTDLKKEKAVLTDIHKMISAGYTPLGCRSEYSNSFSGAYPPAGKNWIADQFSYKIWILPYLCDPNSADKTKYYVSISTPTNVSIDANVIYTLNNLYAADLPDDDFRGYLKLPRIPQKKDGFYYMGEEVVGDSHLQNKTKQYRWLITYDDKLPFYYVNRKEYLIIQKKRLEKTIQQEGVSDFYNNFLNLINENLKKSEAELSMPAICKWNDEERFNGFVEEGTPGSFIAVKPNLDYYNKKLQKSVPQFFSVVYTISHGNPVFEGNINAIKKSVDFATLRNMLGKEATKPF